MRDDLSALAGSPIPDGIEPLPAYRAWQVTRDRPRKLCSFVGGASAWLPGVPAEARCVPMFASMPVPIEPEPTHPAPEERCRCGLYGLKTLELLIAATRHPRFAIGSPNVVFGRIEVWGKVIVATKGYRAQWARVAELYAAPGQEELVAELADTYEVEVGGDTLPPLLAS